MNINQVNSLEWLRKVNRIIPGGCSTIAKSPNRLVPGITPICSIEAKGARFLDLDGNEWLDCEMAMGTVIWGHSRKEINDAVIRQLNIGSTFSTPGILELEVAEKIIGRIGHYNSLRFCKSGADAVSAAVRISRALTGKTKVIYGAYHGWQDWAAWGYYGKNCSRLGLIPAVGETSIWLEEEKIQSVIDKIENPSDIACVVVCPGNWPKVDLQQLKKYCDEHSLILIFDEVSTFMRTGKQGITGQYNVWPDMLCISKGLTNGLPLAAVIGDREFISLCDQIKFSNAHSSECIALAAANASETLLEKTETWPSWRSKAESLMDSIRDYIVKMNLSQDLVISGNCGCFRVHSPGKTIHTDGFRRVFLEELAANKIFSTGYILLSDMHTEEDCELIKDSTEKSIKKWRYKSK